MLFAQFHPLPWVTLALVEVRLLESFGQKRIDRWLNLRQEFSNQLAVRAMLRTKQKAGRNSSPGYQAVALVSIGLATVFVPGLARESGSFLGCRAILPPSFVNNDDRRYPEVKLLNGLLRSLKPKTCLAQTHSKFHIMLCTTISTSYPF